MVSSNDVTITEVPGGSLVVQREGFPAIDIWAAEAAALRAYFVAERMPEDVQKLVDEVMRRAPMRITDDGIIMQASDIEAMIADALEAAYSQTGAEHPVSCDDCGHDSDCALHDAPAFPPGACTCKPRDVVGFEGTQDALDALTIRKEN